MCCIYIYKYVYMYILYILYHIYGIFGIFKTKTCKKNM